MISLWDVIEAAGSDDLDVVTKDMFGELVHSSNQEDIDKALAALEAAGGYENLED